MKALTILIIDDEQLIRWSFEKQLSSKGYRVFSAESGEEGILLFEAHEPDIVFLDNKLPNLQGLDVIPRLKAIREDTSIVFMTAYGSIETAVNAMKLGAVDYVGKPFTFPEIHAIIDNIRQKISLHNEVQLLRRQQQDKVTFDHIIAESDSIRKIIQLARKISRTSSSTVLLLGESGTGKDMFAKAIHQESDRHDKPFVTINCSSLPETLLESELFGHEQGAFTDAKKQKKGLFEIADGGTVFLDEIGEMNMATQVKLLTVIENRTLRRLGGSKDIPIDIRIIAATNRNLDHAMEEKAFREDLYYRLKVFQISLPSLREHPEDIPFLARFFISQFNAQFHKNIEKIDPLADRLLSAYNWPGNIRELRNVMERAVILQAGDVLQVENLPQEITGALKDSPPLSDTLSEPAAPATDFSTPEGVSLYELEKQALIRALEKENYNQSRAARLLKITRDTLRYKMKKYKLQ